MNYIAQYIDEIRSGRIVTSEKVKKLYFNIIEPVILDKHPKYRFDEKRGEKIIKFMERFCWQSKGKWRGKPLKLLLFQKAKWQAIFGIIHRETGLRRFQEIFDVRARKNCKTTEHAPVGLYLTREEDGAEVYACAATYKQAKRVWGEAKSMVAQNPALSGNKSPRKGKIGHGPYMWKVFPESDIYISERDSHFIALASNVDALDGLNSSAAIIDEVHTLTREIYDLIKQSMSARSQPLLSMISTGGFVREGLYDDMYDYSTKVLDGIIEDDTFFPLIYELDNEEEIYDEDCWIKSNPAIDVIKDRAKLRALVERMSVDLNLANTVKTKDFNLRGVENKAWLNFEIFNNEQVYSEEDLKKLDGTIVLGGFDLSRCGDITAFTTLLFDKENRKVIAKTMYWMTHNFRDDQVKKNSRVPWDAWIERKLIRLSGDTQINYHDIVNYVMDEIKEHGYIYQHINYDSYSAEYLVQDFEAQGFAKKHCLISTRQGFLTLSVPMQTVESHLKEKILVYQNNPVTKWMFSNVELVQDRNGNYMPKKAGDQLGRKIDGVATIINGYVSLCQNIEQYLS